MVMTDRLRTYKKEEVIFSYIFILPIIILAVTFIVIPLLSVFWLGFVNWDMMSGGKFVGLKNYKYLIGNEKFLKSIFNTLYTSLCSFTKFPSRSIQSARDAR